MHAGDVLAQLERAIANVDALLNADGSGFSDMMHLFVYLRDPTEFARVDDHLKNRHLELPRLIVQGVVCRPEWLVEVEGIAIAANDHPALPAF
jgi:enamine deaminase RidA (YjgF/YER057c/UK114 family)